MKAIPTDRNLLSPDKRKKIFKTGDNDKVPMSYEEIRNVVEEEFEKKRSEFYDEAYRSIMSKSLAYFLYYLYICEGWREIRLRRAVVKIRETILLGAVPTPQGNCDSDSIIARFKDAGYFDIEEEVML